MAKYEEKWKTLFPEAIGNQARPQDGIDNTAEYNTDGFPRFIANDPVRYDLQNAFLSQLFSNDERLCEFYKNYKKEIDAAIGDRTINDNIVADNKTGSLTNLLSKLGNMIKNVTGKPNWYTAPATTLQALSDLIVDVASPNKLLKLDNSGKLPATITGDAHTVDGKHATDFANSQKITAVQANDINLLPGIYSVEGETLGNLPTKYNTLIGGEFSGNGYGSQIALPYEDGKYNGIWYRIADGQSYKNFTKLAESNHTHSYAGSDTVGGKANNAKVADKLVYSNNSQETELAWIYGEGTPDRVMGCSANGPNKFIAFNPANFNVNYAKSSDNADTVDGKHATDFLLTSGGVLAENANLVIPSNWLSFSFIEKDGRIINSINKKQYDSKSNLIDIEVVDDNWYKALEIKTNGDINIRGNSVITTEKFDFTIIYPNGGNAANPAKVAVNSRYVWNNPFAGYHILCIAEVYYNNQWCETGFIYSPSFDGGYGTKATHLLPADQIVVQTGNYAVLTVSCHAGNGFGILGNTPITTPLPCRVKVLKIGGKI